MLRPGPAMRDGSPLSSQMGEYCAVGHESVVKIATPPHSPYGRGHGESLAHAYCRITHLSDLWHSLPQFIAQYLPEYYTYNSLNSECLLIYKGIKSTCFEDELAWLTKSGGLVNPCLGQVCGWG